MNKILLFFIVFYFSNSIAKESVSSLDSVLMEVEYVDSEGNQIDKSKLPKDLILRFPMIKGSFFGNSDPEAMFLQKPDANYQLTLDLHKAMKKAKKNAEKLSSKIKALGLESKPKNAKILRLGTFAYDLKTKKIIASAGFKDQADEVLLMLVYVNKKSNFFGQLIFGEERYTHDINFPSKGFYWLGIQETSKNEFLISLCSPKGKVLFSIITNASQ